jgi:hypothetical protein
MISLAVLYHLWRSLYEKDVVDVARGCRSLDFCFSDVQRRLRRDQNNQIEDSRLCVIGYHDHSKFYCATYRRG